MSKLTLQGYHVLLYCNGLRSACSSLGGKKILCKWLGKVPFLTKRKKKCLKQPGSSQPWHKAMLDDIGSYDQNIIFSASKKVKALGLQLCVWASLIVCTDTCSSFPANLLSQTNKTSLQHLLSGHYWFTCMCYLNSKRLLGFTPSVPSFSRQSLLSTKLP